MSHCHFSAVFQQENVQMLLFFSVNECSQTNQGWERTECTVLSVWLRDLGHHRTRL